MSTTSFILIDQSAWAMVFLEGAEDWPIYRASWSTFNCSIWVCACACPWKPPALTVLFFYSTLGSWGALEPVYILPSVWQPYLFLQSTEFMLISDSISHWWSGASGSSYLWTIKPKRVINVESCSYKKQPSIKIIAWSYCFRPWWNMNCEAGSPTRAAEPCVRWLTLLIIL